MTPHITGLGAFLPNAPVPNEAIENVLGRINDLPSRTRAIVLRNNKIRTRHYAIDPATGFHSHTNSEMVVEAVKAISPAGGLDLNTVDCLACGSTSPDLINPGLASMVHGELGILPLEVASTQGICLSGMAAFRYAMLAVQAGVAQRALATGSELASSLIRAGAFHAGASAAAVDLEKKPVLGFDADFLRWMLSDGAGAALIESEPRPGQLNLRIEWMELLSFANELPTCMYIGGRKEADGRMTGWRTIREPDQVLADNLLAVRQDVELLNREIIPTAVDRALTRVLAKHPMKPSEIDWFLPHYSSNYFREKLHDAMQAIGFGIPYEKWFTNLESKGNTGSASIYIIMEELYRSGRLKPGQKILCFIPESGRFSIAYMLLTVV